MLRLFCLFLISTSLQATVFQLQPIEQQIRESDGVFQGHYLRKKTVELENGRLATQMVFKMTKETGLNSDFFGMDEVIIHYPGGALKGRHTRVEGVPEFVQGEKVVLFIKNVDSRYWGMNLGFGSFKVINYGNEVLLVNSLFPENPKVGQVTMQAFEQAVKKIKGSKLKVVQTLEYPTNIPQSNTQRSPASVSEGQNRSVASKSSPSDNEGDQRELPMFWLIAALGVMGGVFRWRRLRI